MPYLVGDLPDGFLRVICAGYSGVVDEDVDAAELGDGALDEGVDLFGVGDVGGYGDGPAAIGQDGVDGLLDGAGPTACGNDVGAKLGEGHGDLSTEA